MNPFTNPNPPIELPSNMQKVWLFSQNPDGTMAPAVLSGGGGGGNVNLTGINGVAPALTHPLPVEISDGTNAFGTALNPLNVNVVAGGGANPSVVVDGTPTSYYVTQIGWFNQGTGTAYGVTPTTPLPVSVVGSVAVSGSVSVSGTVTSSSNTNDGSGNPITSTSGALDVNLLSSSLSSSNMVGTDPGIAPVSTSIVGMKYNVATQAPTNGQTLPLQSDANGNLKTTLIDSLLPTSNMVGTAPGTAPADTSIVGGKYNATPPTFTDGQTGPLQFDVNGNLKTTAAISGSVTVSGTVTTKDAADGADGAAAPTFVIQVGGRDSNNNLQAVATDISGQQFVAFQGQLLTVFQEILAEVRATRRLLMMVYEESGEGNPTASLLDDPSEPKQVDYQ